MPEIKDLLHAYSHFQRDLESVKQRQWRDFYTSILGQGGILFLYQQYKDFESIGCLFFVFLSLLAWAAGTWFLIESKEVLKNYRTAKSACLKELKGADSDLGNILDPPPLPVITGKLHHVIYSFALFAVTLLVMFIVQNRQPASQFFPVTVLIMTTLALLFSYSVPRLIKDNYSVRFYPVSMDR